MKHLLMTLILGVSAMVYGYEVENLTPEAHLAGPTITKADLEGKVLLIEYFGFGCGPCVAAMPGTVALAEKVKQKDARFVAVISHVWPRNDPRIAAFFESVGGAKLPAYQDFLVKGFERPRGVPHALLVGPDGKKLWEGHPANHEAMAAAIDKALKALPKQPATAR